jgi:hypothetical protein
LTSVILYWIKPKSFFFLTIVPIGFVFEYFKISNKFFCGTFNFLFLKVMAEVMDCKLVGIFLVLIKNFDLLFNSTNHKFLMFFKTFILFVLFFGFIQCETVVVKADGESSVLTPTCSRTTCSQATVRNSAPDFKAKGKTKFFKDLSCNAKR